MNSASIHELIDFIADELPRWRDHPDRSKKTAETALTSQLCGHLNTAARLSRGWDFMQFRIEEPDEHKKGRKIDLVASPCSPTVWIEGRRCTQFDILLPIECKRLPTPKDNGRDEREYIFNRHASTGGIQRFKEGNHGAAHSLVAMIAYVQNESPKTWHERLNAWIRELGISPPFSWFKEDLLSIERVDVKVGLTTLRSLHSRGQELCDINIRHLWIEMS